jgi:hypothetical protein
LASTSAVTTRPEPWPEENGRSAARARTTTKRRGHAAGGLCRHLGHGRLQPARRRHAGQHHRAQPSRVQPSDLLATECTCPCAWHGGSTRATWPCRGQM